MLITRNVKCQLVDQIRKYLVICVRVVNLLFKMTSIAMEEYELMKDSKYRMYVAAVDKALKNFEYTSEWADLIAALGKLNKVVNATRKYKLFLAFAFFVGAHGLYKISCNTTKN